MHSNVIIFFESPFQGLFIGIPETFQLFEFGRLDIEICLGFGICHLEFWPPNPVWFRLRRVRIKKSLESNSAHNEL